jgi:hypothetical protein
MKSGLENRMVARSPIDRNGESVPREPEPAPDPLAERLKAAKQVQPTGRDVHCLDCFRRGRDAAIRIIEGR